MDGNLWLIIGGLLVLGLFVWLVLARSRVEVGGSLSGPVLPSTMPRISPGPEVEAEARAWLARRQKIEAIKLVREQTGMGLKEAKDYVARL